MGVYVHGSGGVIYPPKQLSKEYIYVRSPTEMCMSMHRHRFVSWFNYYCAHAFSLDIELGLIMQISKALFKQEKNFMEVKFYGDDVKGNLKTALWPRCSNQAWIEAMRLNYIVPIAS